MADTRDTTPRTVEQARFVPNLNDDLCGCGQEGCPCRDPHDGDDSASRVRLLSARYPLPPLPSETPARG